MTDAGETLHLKSFLADPACPKGECGDFADFLVCLSTSAGATPIMKAQRSGPLAGPGFDFNKLLDPAGTIVGPGTGHWRYHEFGLVTSAAWDRAIWIIEQNFGVPKNWDRNTTYRIRLVTGGTWNPQPDSGFTPAVTTNPPP